ncbi:MAG: hypothetical protein L6437_13715 [Kiritimatiellae bacterium]|nr:hypothetical protein [Kiritimatiellia bacterium]
MKSDGQHYLCCEQCGEYVNSSEAAAHRCPKPTKDHSKVMAMGKALEIVLAMARSLYNSHGEFCEPAKCPADATNAMNTVEDFIVNHFEEDDEAQNQIRQERLSALFDAMEHHGNAEGTETQLGDAEEFLRLAFDNMSPTQQTEFLDSPAVSEFVTRESGNKEDAK